MGTEKNPVDESASSLPRVLGVWISIAIVVGTIIGSGVFLKPRSIAQSVPDSSTSRSSGSSAAF